MNKTIFSPRVKTSSFMPPAQGLLQRKCACGNHTITGGECAECAKNKSGLQRKLAIGASNDPLEFEADRVADQVMAAPLNLAVGAAPPSIQRYMGQVTEGSGFVPASVDRVLAGSGRPLEPVLRQDMEQRFGHDFASVRVHADPAAEQSARDLNANAYTVGHNVVFGAGRFAPGTQVGRKLIAHELTHVVQQRSVGSLGIQRQADEEHDKIVNLSKRTTGNLTGRAWEIVWRMLTRYFPEYSGNVAAVGYDEKEQGVKVNVKEIDRQGKKIQSATVTVGKRFVEDTSADTLRERIVELGESLSASGLKAIPDPQASAGTAKVWKIINDKFPKKGRRLAGSSYDANLPGLATEFKAVNVQVGKVNVSVSAPKLYFGKTFLALPEGDQETKIGEELKQVDKWSVENFRIFKEDLNDEDITLRIRGLSSARLTQFRDKSTDPAVKQYAGSLLTVSTPLGQGLTRQPNGTLSAKVGNLTLVVLPDNTGTSGIARPVTEFTLQLAAIPALRPDRQGMINNFNPPPPLVITIQTSYPPSAGPDVTSGYGRGTTAAEQSLDAKTLRVHEGSHGQEYLTLIVNANSRHPFPPPLNVPNGTPVAQYNTLLTAYIQARRAFFDDVQAGRARANQSVDCVGTTIDQYNRQHHIPGVRVCP
ncbi:DUF4157 domain-containing protein [Methylomonas sp. MED-D]|uniref:eCIS core domain-containing protein n=1 Tax=unclassified Methylomonas TaxID=2608980 RepID=UPI0028A563A1|nr:DUF4157 domain-containing protein [Methylomonas sp. MV1]MDT4331507.1 DUF4157 domain-containing protein [Methylomonas sp. MV1]